MVDMRYSNQITPGRATSDGAGFRAVEGDRDGNIGVIAKLQRLGLEGRLFGAHFGGLTTPLTTAATTAITTLRPAVWVRVPDGTLIIPVAVEITVESSGGTTQGEILIGQATSDVGNGTSAAGTAGPVSLNSAAPITSGCTCRQLASADVTADYALELKRFGFAASAVNQDYSWRPIQSAGLLSVLRGPSTLLVYIGGNAVVFYAQIHWAEVPENSIS